jgi:hypothetical protein
MLPILTYAPFTALQLDILELFRIAEYLQVYGCASLCPALFKCQSPKPEGMQETFICDPLADEGCHSISSSIQTTLECLIQCRSPRGRVHIQVLLPEQKRRRLSLSSSEDEELERVVSDLAVSQWRGLCRPPRCLTSYSSATASVGPHRRPTLVTGLRHQNT